MDGAFTGFPNHEIRAEALEQEYRWADWSTGVVSRKRNIKRKSYIEEIFNFVYQICRLLSIWTDFLLTCFDNLFLKNDNKGNLFHLFFKYFAMLC